MSNNDMYNSYDDCDFEYGYPVHEELVTSNWFDNDTSPMLCKYHASYIIDYGDTTSLSFEIDNDYTSNYNIEITIYNFRYESIYSNDYTVDNGYVYLKVDSDLSSKLQRGVYYICVKAISTVTGADDICTLYNPANCLLYVR